MECELKGYLSYLILWIIHKKTRNGAEITREIEKRRGTKPNPGTIYPLLKELKNKGLISINEKKYYSLTLSGEEELKEECKFFCKIFHDVDEMIKFSEN